MEHDKDHLPDSDQPGETDRFYQGVIHNISWNNETGLIRSQSGRTFPFVFAYVTLLGAPRHDLRFLFEGMRVGFDVGWTSHGLRVTVIKVYDL